MRRWRTTPFAIVMVFVAFPYFGGMFMWQEHHQLKRIFSTMTENLRSTYDSDEEDLRMPSEDENDTLPVSRNSNNDTRVITQQQIQHLMTTRKEGNTSRTQELTSKTPSEAKRLEILQAHEKIKRDRFNQRKHIFGGLKTSRGGSSSLVSKRLVKTRAASNQIRLYQRDRKRPIPTRNDTRILYFLHIHKAGGTTMCHLAQNANEKVSNKNCNVQPDQRCCGDDTLQGHAKFAKETPFSFVACERQMYSVMDTQHYRYILTLRNSQARYLSHWQHLKTVEELKGKIGDYTEWWQGQPDNWNVRQICGTRCLATPKFQLSREDWEYTLARVDQFEHYLFVETFSESYAKFAPHVGWDPQLQIHKNKREEKAQPKPNEVWDPLMSALDDLLYEYAQIQDGSRESLVNETVAGMDRYFQEGPLRDCASPCCAKECTKYR